MHCDWGKGCKIYARRPSPCVDFDCSYLLSPSLSEEWKPTISHFVLGYMTEADVTIVYVDSDYVGAWRQEPYYSVIKRWAATTEQGYVLVYDDKGTLALAGTDEFNLGVLRDDQVIVRHEQPTPAGKKIAIYAIDKHVADMERRGQTPPA
jgi:hypothetical protein